MCVVCACGFVLSVVSLQLSFTVCRLFNRRSFAFDFSDDITSCFLFFQSCVRCPSLSSLRQWHHSCEAGVAFHQKTHNLGQIKEQEESEWERERNKLWRLVKKKRSFFFLLFLSNLIKLKSHTFPSNFLAALRRFMSDPAGNEKLCEGSLTWISFKTEALVREASC